MVKFHFSQIEESCNNNNIIINNLQILPFYHFTILPLIAFLLDSQHLVGVKP